MATLRALRGFAPTGFAGNITAAANAHKQLRYPQAKAKKGLTDLRLLCHNFFTQPQEV
jgi:hypothetical protein